MKKNKGGKMTNWKEQPMKMLEKKKVFENLESRLSLYEFDSHLDNYIKVMQIKKFTLKIFYAQFKLCFYQGLGYWEKYQYFKQNSRHINQLSLGV